MTEAELVTWGERIGREAEPPLVIALRGDLGAGKTTLARAIARGAGVSGTVASPTYNLLLRHPADRGVDVVHIDLFRLGREEEVWELGWDELPGERDLVLIEWPEKAEALLPPTRWEILLEEGDDAATRRTAMRAIGEPPRIPTPADKP